MSPPDVLHNVASLPQAPVEILEEAWFVKKGKGSNNRQDHQRRWYGKFDIVLGSISHGFIRSFPPFAPCDVLYLISLVHMLLRC